MTSVRPASPRSRPAVWAVLLSLCAGLLVQQPAQAAPFVLGTDQLETTSFGRLYRKLYAEAFRRLGVPLQVVHAPTQRLAVMLAQGEIDGEVVRALAYGQMHPEFVRVDEPVMDIVFTLYTARPGLAITRADELAAGGLQGAYKRGVVFCERTLKPLLPPERLADVTDSGQGLAMLLAGRADFYCDVNVAFEQAQADESVKGAAAARKLLEMERSPLYPYLHPRHAELAPRLAATLRQMKAEGLIERYRQEAISHAAGR